jgi:hypothetical protein
MKIYGEFDLTKYNFTPFIKIYMGNTFTSAEFDIFDDKFPNEV